MLRRIKPLDNSVISKGVSEASKDSMKQTISTMLGLLPSDHFDVTVSFEIQPLHRLLVSSIITGYTLWNAEYRMSLTRNLEMSHADQGADCETPLESLELKGGEEEHGETEKVVSDLGLANSEICSSSTGAGVFGDLPPQALKYIQQLQSELTNMKEELNAQKQEMMQLEHDRGIRNNLLEYLRSFDPDMVTEMSRPSSEEVEDIIHQLVQNILRRFLVDEASSNFMEQSVEGNIDDGDEFSDKIATSRDYLAKLLFWQVYVIRSSLKRIGKQIAFELCCWTFIENNNGGSLVYSSSFSLQHPKSPFLPPLYNTSYKPCMVKKPVQCKTGSMGIIKFSPCF